MKITKEVLDALGITRADVLEAIATATSEDTGWESLRRSVWVIESDDVLSTQYHKEVCR